MNTINHINSVQFQGKTQVLERRRAFLQNKASGILNQNYKDIVELSKDAPIMKLNFLDKLLEKYNQFNFYRKPEEKDNSLLVNNIFEMIKKPKGIHFAIAERFGESFENMSRIFTSGLNNKKYLQFAKLVNDDIVRNYGSESKDFIPELLESPFADKYVKNYKAIRPYLIANKDKPDVVSKLDKMFETKTYDKDLFNVEFNENKIKNEFNYKGTEILNKDIYLENYNRYSHELMHTLKKAVNFSDEMLEKGADKSILKALQTSNKGNVELRRSLTRNLVDTFHELDTDVKTERLNALVRVFDKIDEDKHAKNFIKKSIGHMPDSLNANDLEDILNNVSTKKLDIFRKNAWNIIKQTERSERISELSNNIKNPFYLSNYLRSNLDRHKFYGFSVTPTFFSKIALSIENGFNILRDKLTSETSKIVEMPKAPERGFAKSGIEERANIVSIKPETKSDVNAETKPVTSPLKENSKSEKILNIKNAKQVVVDEVLSFVNSKLGQKTFAKQNELYTKNATKMRLSMLPEIFASIIDTRKADRAVGKKHSYSANKDVLNLYLKINGSNKKFVNYLLKKRNVDNTRMFEVKDIIAMLDKAEAKIAQAKKLNPEYRAKDARKYYNHLYEAKIEQFGKVKPQRKLKTNA